MKETVWGYWIVALGIFVIVVMMLLQNFTTTSQQDYYLLREITNASMHEAIDLAHFRKTGELRIIKEKFVENWIRRFADTVNINREYDIRFVDIWEAPPKASVQVTSGTGQFATMGEVTEFDIVNRLDVIFEFDPADNSDYFCYFRNPTLGGFRIAGPGDLRAPGQDPPSQIEGEFEEDIYNFGTVNTPQ